MSFNEIKFCYLPFIIEYALINCINLWLYTINNGSLFLMDIYLFNHLFFCKTIYKYIDHIFIRSF